jgi:hypothetical protein
MHVAEAVGDAWRRRAALHGCRLPRPVQCTPKIIDQCGQVLLVASGAEEMEIGPPEHG